MTPEADPRRELMDELRRRFQDSAATLRRVARRIQEAADASQAVDRRARHARRPLADDVEAAPTSFTYVEYLEFSSAEEFKRFRHAPPIRREEVEAVDLDDLARRLTDPTSSE